MSSTLMIPGQWEPRPSKVVTTEPGRPPSSLVPLPPVRAPEPSRSVVAIEPRSWLGVSILALLVVAMLLAMWAVADGRTLDAARTTPDAASPHPIPAAVGSLSGGAAR